MGNIKDLTDDIANLNADIKASNTAIENIDNYTKRLRNSRDTIRDQIAFDFNVNFKYLPGWRGNRKNTADEKQESVIKKFYRYIDKITRNDRYFIRK